MNIKALLHVAVALPVLSSPMIVQAQSVPITVGMNYGVARQRLIRASWQPLMLCGVRALWSYGSQAYMDLQIKLAAAFRQRGWYETLGCAATGLGTC